MLESYKSLQETEVNTLFSNDLRTENLDKYTWTVEFQRLDGMEQLLATAVPQLSAQETLAEFHKLSTWFFLFCLMNCALDTFICSSISVRPF